MKDKVIVIEGPTSSGKTELSVELAKKINGEIVSSDSMQIYKDMQIGTSKVTKEEMQGIQHYLVDCISPNQRYSVADFKKDAKDAIKKILSKGKVPIVVGGTGLFIDSLIYEITYPNIEFDEGYRKELEIRVEQEGLDTLYLEAKEIDELAVSKISKTDKKRILRILEIYKSTGRNKTYQEIESRKEKPEFDYTVYALTWERETLYNRINYKVDSMLEAGLVEEVKNICFKYKEFPTAMQGLGYKEVVKYLKGITTYEEMVAEIKQETRRYAKRQLTWFRKNKQTIWLNGEDGLDKNLRVITEEYFGRK